jgi:catechol 2,3-dioxygenase-like lactoylglutathione lyase family enzyme
VYPLPDSRYFPAFLGERMQVGMVVNDLDAALRYWTEVLEVGPWVVIEESLGDRQLFHRGEQSPVQMSLALSYVGETQVELITQTNDAPSPYREFLDEGREGVHHIAFWPQDYETAVKELERRGFEEIMTVRTADGEKNVSYFRSPPVLGVMVEVVPLTQARRAYYSAIEALARTWDGDRPIRRYRTRPDFLASQDVARLNADASEA